MIWWHLQIFRLNPRKKISFVYFKKMQEQRVWLILNKNLLLPDFLVWLAHLKKSEFSCYELIDTQVFENCGGFFCASWVEIFWGLVLLWPFVVWLYCSILKIDTCFSDSLDVQFRMRVSPLTVSSQIQFPPLLFAASPLFW